MAHFYGNLSGSRGSATRCSTKDSGLSVSARSWAGSVTVNLSEYPAGTHVEILAAPGSAQGGKILYSGPVADLVRAVSLVPQDPAPGGAE